MIIIEKKKKHQQHLTAPTSTNKHTNMPCKWKKENTKKNVTSRTTLNGSIGTKTETVRNVVQLCATRYEEPSVKQRIRNERKKNAWTHFKYTYLSVHTFMLAW